MRGGFPRRARVWRSGCRSCCRECSAGGPFDAWIAASVGLGRGVPADRSPRATIHTHKRVFSPVLSRRFGVLFQICGERVPSGVTTDFNAPVEFLIPAHQHHDDGDYDHDYDHEGLRNQKTGSVPPRLLR